jgi:hypothetical protein
MGRECVLVAGFMGWVNDGCAEWWVFLCVLCVGGGCLRGMGMLHVGMWCCKGYGGWGFFWGRVMRACGKAVGVWAYSVVGIVIA